MPGVVEKGLVERIMSSPAERQTYKLPEKAEVSEITTHGIERDAHMEYITVIGRSREMGKKSVVHPYSFPGLLTKNIHVLAESEQVHWKCAKKTYKKARRRGIGRRR